jgi:GMP reductase
MQKIIEGIKLDYDDVLICPKRSSLNSRSEVSLIRDFTFKYSPRKLTCSPIFVANMDTTGTFAMAKSLCPQDALVALHKHYSLDDLIQFYLSNPEINDKVFYSLGTSDSDLEKLYMVLERLKNNDISYPNICVDVANGYSEKFVKTLADIRSNCEDAIILAGNVVTANMTEELIMHGWVDIVKVGIGPGAVCTTRLKTGVGYGQVSACLECADAAHGLGAHICADGGCKHPGDICKAFGCNSDFVMLGNMFAGTDECEGEWTYEYRGAVTNLDGTTRSEWWQSFPGHKTQQRKKTFKFYGMSSKEAMEKHSGGVANYRTSEGRCVTMPYKGLATDILADIYGGLRSSCTYIGAEKIKDFGKKTTFIRVNNTHTKTHEKT